MLINIVTKLLIIIAGFITGYFFPFAELAPLVSSMVAGIIATFLAGALFFFEKSSPGMIAGGLTGFVLSVWLSGLLVNVVLSGLSSPPEDLKLFVTYLVTALLVVAGTGFGLLKGRWLTPVNIKAALNPESERKSFKILDTSVIIDGRIADISETGFLGGILVIPQFVLKELQLVADSSQSLKRNRGRRGLDILQKIKKMSNVQVIISEQDYPEIQEVDSKLIELAKSIGGKIVTNDFNLNKVAQLRGVEVLNINELANALKPVVLPGELMNVFILKEGKEAIQGIGYLDDGTMIVVDNARHLIGQTIELMVTSVLQTTAGKMIFGKTEEGKAAHLAQN